MTAVLAAVLTAALVRLGAPVRRSPDPKVISTGARAREDKGLLAALRWPLSIAAGVGGWVVLGGPVGALAGVAAGVISWRVLTQVEPPAAARRRRALERDLPIAVHLFGSALAVGASATRALSDVAAALPGPVAEEFGLVRRRLDIGVDPVSVWRDVDGPLEPLGRTMARAHESGALVVAAVDRLGGELRAGVDLRRAALVRGVEVRAAVPLGLCFLPAFVALGVIPMVVGIFSSLTLFG